MASDGDAQAVLFEEWDVSSGFPELSKMPPLPGVPAATGAPGSSAASVASDRQSQSALSLRPRKGPDSKPKGRPKKDAAVDDGAAGSEILREISSSMRTLQEDQQRLARGLAASSSHPVSTATEATWRAWVAKSHTLRNLMKRRVATSRSECLWRHKSKMAATELFLQREERLFEKIKRREEELRGEYNARLGDLGARFREAVQREKDAKAALAAMTGALAKLPGVKAAPNLKAPARPPAKAPKGKTTTKSTARKMLASKGKKTKAKAKKGKAKPQAAKKKGNGLTAAVLRKFAAKHQKQQLPGGAQDGAGAARGVAAEPLLAKSGGAEGMALVPTSPTSPTPSLMSPAVIEFVGAPVGKGSKVPSGLWPWSMEASTTRRGDPGTSGGRLR